MTTQSEAALENKMIQQLIGLGVGEQLKKSIRGF